MFRRGLSQLQRRWRPDGATITDCSHDIRKIVALGGIFLVCVTFEYQQGTYNARVFFVSAQNSVTRSNRTILGSCDDTQIVVIVV